MGENLVCPFFARFSNGPNLGPFVSPTKKPAIRIIVPMILYGDWVTLFTWENWLSFSKKKGRGLIYWSETQVGIEYLLCITKEARGYLVGYGLIKKNIDPNWCILIHHWTSYSQLSHLIYYKLFSSFEQGILKRQKDISTITETYKRSCSIVAKDNLHKLRLFSVRTRCI